MQAVTDQEMRERLVAYPELRCEGKDVRFASSPEARTIVIDCRVPEPHQIVYLARTVAHLWFDEREFGGASLWLTQWGVWSPEVEGASFAILERMRQGWREYRPVIDAPGHIFREEELVESVSCSIRNCTRLIGLRAPDFRKMIRGQIPARHCRPSYSRLAHEPAAPRAIAAGRGRNSC